MYKLILSAEESSEDIENLKRLQAHPQLRFLREITDEDRKYSRNFSAENKTAAFLREAMQNELKCAICGARLHFKSISMDHIVRKQDGGTDLADNMQLTHPYCNSGYKESIVARSAGQKS